MAVYDLEEQEQLDAVKRWWRTNGNRVTWAVTAVAVALAGYQGYRYYQGQQTLKAADAYAQVEKAVRAKDNKAALEAAARLEREFAGTGFAGMAALAAAKAAFDQKDLKAAREHLQWAADKAGDETLRATARLRLAGVLLDEKNHDAALAQLNGSFPESFAGLVADARGDVLTAQGKPAEARAAYKLALEKLPADNTYRPVVEVKLDDLGGAS